MFDANTPCIINNEEGFDPRLVLARALAPALGAGSLETLKAACEASAISACVPIIEAGRSSDDPAIARDFSIQAIRALLELSEDGKSIEGTVRLEMQNTSHERYFISDIESASIACAQCALCALIQAHGWLSEGFDHQREPSEYDTPTDQAARVFCASLDGAGDYGLWFKQRLLAQARSEHPRWQAKAFLEDAAKSLAGTLLPHAARHSRITLSDGLPGESTRLYSWEVSDVGGYGAHDRRDWVEEHHGFWSLPSLEAGHEALWEAICQRIARMAADGPEGPAPSRFMREHGYARQARSMVEREILSLHAGESDTASRGPKSL